MSMRMYLVFAGVSLALIGTLFATVLATQLDPEATKLSERCDRWVEMVDQMRVGKANPIDVENYRIRLEEDARANRVSWANALRYRKDRHLVVPATLDR